MPASDITSLIPIAVALGLSLYTRNVIVGLFTGVFVGVLMLNGPNPLAGAGIIPILSQTWVSGLHVPQSVNRETWLRPPLGQPVRCNADARELEGVRTHADSRNQCEPI